MHLITSPVSMHQIVKPPVETSRRWLVLAIVVAAQFMFGVDAFIVNVAIPTIAAELKASSAQIEAVIAIYLIAYATLVVTGGRLGDIYGTKRVFIAGVLGFTVTSLWCGLAQSGVELIVARLAQGATAALMVPQVLATLHLLFSDRSGPRLCRLWRRARACRRCRFCAWRGAGDVGSRRPRLARGVLRQRAVRTCTSLPRLANHADGAAPRRHAARHSRRRRAVCWLAVPDRPAAVRPRGALVAVVWLAMAAGVVILAAFFKLEGNVAARGGMPLIDLALLAERVFMRGLAAVLFFFLANLSFYLVLTMFMQRALLIPPLAAGLVFLPLAFAFVIASRHSAARARHRGTLVLIEGCVLQLVGIGTLVATVEWIAAPSAMLLALVLAIFGYGQGLVMAPLSSAVLSGVKPQRRLGLRHLRHDCTDCECGRSGRNRCGILCR